MTFLHTNTHYKFYISNIDIYVHDLYLYMGLVNKVSYMWVATFPLMFYRWEDVTHKLHLIVFTVEALLSCRMFQWHRLFFLVPWVLLLGFLVLVFIVSHENFVMLTNSIKDIWYWSSRICTLSLLVAIRIGGIWHMVYTSHLHAFSSFVSLRWCFISHIIMSKQYKYQ
jgi:hypothetical protein